MGVERRPGCALDKNVLKKNLQYYFYYIFSNVPKMVHHPRSLFHHHLHGFQCIL